MIKQYILVASMLICGNMQASQFVRSGMMQPVARMVTAPVLQNRRLVSGLLDRTSAARRIGLIVPTARMSMAISTQVDNKQEVQVAHDNSLQQKVAVDEAKIQLIKLLKSQLDQLLLEKKELLVYKHAAMGAGIIFTIPYFYALSIHDDVAGSIIAFTSTVTALPMWSKFYGARSDLITLEKQIKVTQENIARVEKDQPLKLDN